MISEHVQKTQLEALLDGEDSPSVAAAREHISSCANCAELLHSEIELLQLLEGLPQPAPSVHFSDRVMSQVSIFEPVHITLLDTVRRMIPARGRARLAFGSVVGASGIGFSVLVLWATTHAESVAFVFGLGLEALRSESLRTLQYFSAVVVGQPTAQALGDTRFGSVWLAAALLLVSGGLAGFALRSLILAARRGRS